MKRLILCSIISLAVISPAIADITPAEQRIKLISLLLQTPASEWSRVRDGNKSLFDAQLSFYVRQRMDLSESSEARAKIARLYIWVASEVGESKLVQAGPDRPQHEWNPLQCGFAPIVKVEPVKNEELPLWVK